MLKGDFEFIVGSPSEREKLICEIYYKKRFFAIISQETDQLIIELFDNEAAKRLEIPLEQFLNALEFGKKYLLGDEIKT